MSSRLRPKRGREYGARHRPKRHAPWRASHSAHRPAPWSSYGPSTPFPLPCGPTTMPLRLASGPLTETTISRAVECGQSCFRPPAWMLLSRRTFAQDEQRACRLALARRPLFSESNHAGTELPRDWIGHDPIARPAAGLWPKRWWAGSPPAWSLSLEEQSRCELQRTRGPLLGAKRASGERRRRRSRIAKRKSGTVERIGRRHSRWAGERSDRALRSDRLGVRSAVQ